ncbi:MAG: hypothetical protein JNL21_08780 [Myxococcales bacterium]|nr:hypothetical protein [Myxococcales bacterium]
MSPRSNAARVSPRSMASSTSGGQGRSTWESSSFSSTQTEPPGFVTRAISRTVEAGSASVCRL